MRTLPHPCHSQDSLKIKEPSAGLFSLEVSDREASRGRLFEKESISPPPKPKGRTQPMAGLPNPPFKTCPIKRQAVYALAQERRVLKERARKRERGGSPERPWRWPLTSSPKNTTPSKAPAQGEVRPGWSNAAGVQSLSPVQILATLWTLPTRLLCPWDFPGKNTELDCHSLVQGIFPTQGLNPSPALLADSLLLSHQGEMQTSSPTWIPHWILSFHFHHEEIQSSQPGRPSATSD